MRKPSRELDALVAEKVMGWGWMTAAAAGGVRWLAPPAQVGDWGHVRPAAGDEPQQRSWWLDDEPPSHKLWVVPKYSAEIGAAWPIVEKVRRDGIHFEMLESAPARFAVLMWRPYHRALGCWQHGPAPLAICLAALAALGVEVPA